MPGESVPDHPGWLQGPHVTKRMPPYPKNTHIWVGYPPKINLKLRRNRILTGFLHYLNAKTYIANGQFPPLYPFKTASFIPSIPPSKTPNV